MRISKLPEIRKQEIMEAAMKLFQQKGYEQTSMADIAREVHVVQGLCYRYFPSKQDLFDAALDAYVVSCCRPFIAILCDETKSIDDRIGMSADRMLHPGEEKYKNFFHQKGNEKFHELLSLRMCKYMIPYLATELDKNTKNGNLRIDDVTTVAEFISYGQLALWQEPENEMKPKLEKYQQLIQRLLAIC